MTAKKRLRPVIAMTLSPQAVAVLDMHAARLGCNRSRAADALILSAVTIGTPEIREVDDDAR